MAHETLMLGQMMCSSRVGWNTAVAMTVHESRHKQPASTFGLSRLRQNQHMGQT